MVEDVNSTDQRLRFVLRLLIKHPTIDPDWISDQLRMVPHLSQRAGSERIAPNGERLPGVYRDSRWGWSRRVEGKREFFDEVAKLVNELTPHREVLSKIADDGGCTEIIVHLPGDINIGWSLRWINLKQLGELKIDLGVEVFPDMK